MRYLVEPNDGEPFKLEREDPLEEGRRFTHQNSTYIARIVLPGQDDLDGVIRADWLGTVGPGQNLPA